MIPDYNRPASSGVPEYHRHYPAKELVRGLSPITRMFLTNMNPLGFSFIMLPCYFYECIQGTFSRVEKSGSNISIS
jgi:hypothetical protein